MASQKSRVILKLRSPKGTRGTGGRPYRDHFIHGRRRPRSHWRTL